ncbi:membrane protein [Candidatus Magnetobacterium bavaricum]|uniref:Membrane protein n=1 Tax=Candidatus Magnetobacterium bavaricum TaxID=29290 RepID=A0A0F3GJF0_9BACT|nr:membrane protein [Candidatus Magnetobacterium bavaricum]
MAEEPKKVKDSVQEIIIALLSSGLLFTFVAFIIGFLYTRRLVNYLGIPSEITLPTEIYLQNSFRVIFQIYMNLIYIIVVFIPIFYLLSFIIKKFKFNIAFDVKPFLKPIKNIKPSFFIILLIIALYPFLCYIQETDILFSDNNPQVIDMREKAYFLFLEITFIISLVIYFTVIRETNTTNKWHLLTNGTMIILLSAQFFLLPINFAFFYFHGEFNTVEFLNDDIHKNDKLFLIGFQGENTVIIYNKTKKEIEMFSKLKKDFIIKKKISIFKDNDDKTTK